MAKKAQNQQSKPKRAKRIVSKKNVNLLGNLDQTFNDQTNKLRLKSKKSADIQEDFKINGQFSPTTGKNEKLILDALETSIGSKIVRQFYINGYYLDGYCIELKLAIEVDEPRHRSHGNRAKDRRRQHQISKALNCYFLRINEQEFSTKLAGMKKHFDQIPRILKSIETKEVHLW